LNTAKKTIALAHKTWLAGVGAYDNGREKAANKFDQLFVDGSAFVNDLLETGKSVETQIQAKLEARNMFKGKLSSLRAKLGFGNESRDQQIDMLSQRVDSLIDVVAKLAQQSAAEKKVTTTANAIKKTPAKPVSNATAKKAPAKTTAKPVTKAITTKAPVKTAAKPVAKATETKAPVKTAAKPVAKATETKAPVKTAAKPVAKATETKAPVKTAAKPVAKATETKAPVKTVAKPVAKATETLAPVKTAVKPVVKVTAINVPAKPVVKAAVTKASAEPKADDKD
jgi:hypothetical protein